MSQPATAAIVVGCIVGGVAAVFVGYKAYVKWFNAKHQSGPMILPPAREPQDYASQYLAAPSSSNAMAGTLYGGEGNYGDSWRGSGSQSKASFASHLAYGGSEMSVPYHAHRSSSSQGLLAQSPPTTAEYPSPLSPPSPTTVDGASSSIIPPPLEAYDHVQHPRSISSRSSTQMIKRTYAPSVKSGVGTSSHTSALRRESYLPHLPENRDQIQIVPPQPLGFGLGGMATALDQKTLAFSTTSGIGTGEDDFSRGLVWQEGNPDSAAAAAAAQAHRASKLGEDERLRYLAQGPRVLSPSLRGAVHNHIYAGSNAGSSGMRTPDNAPSSRSRSPGPVAPWDGSSASDIGPSVSQRGAVSPSAPFPHPLEDNTAHSQAARTNITLTNMQSPLALMSGGGATLYSSPSTQKEMTRDSPILGAFRNPPQPTHHVMESGDLASGTHSHSNSQNSGSAASAYLPGERTPGLVSGSVSTGHGSAPTTDNSDRHSTIDMQGQHDAFAIDDGKAKSKPLQVVGIDDLYSATSPSSIAKEGEKKQSRGWRLGKKTVASKT